MQPVSLTHACARTNGQVTARGQPNFWGLGSLSPPISTFMNGRPLHILRLAGGSYSSWVLVSPRDLRVPSPHPHQAITSQPHFTAMMWPLTSRRRLWRETWLVLFTTPSFTTWCQTKPRINRPTLNSTDHRVIMELIWPLPPQVSVNSGTPRESFLGCCKKIHLPSPQDLCDLIHKPGKGCFFYSADVVRTYRKLPMDPSDWPLVCFWFRFKGLFKYMYLF